MAPRMLSSVPFTLGPAFLKWHPKFSGTLLVGAAGAAAALGWM